MKTTRIGTGVVGVILMIAGAFVGYRGECEARDLIVRREQILEDRARRAAEIETELLNPALEKVRRVALESELERCRSRGRMTPGYFAYNARLFGYGIGGFLAVAGVLCAAYAASGGDGPGQP